MPILQSTSLILLACPPIGSKKTKTVSVDITGKCICRSTIPTPDTEVTLGCSGAFREPSSVFRSQDPLVPVWIYLKSVGDWPYKLTSLLWLGFYCKTKAPLPAGEAQKPIISQSMMLVASEVLPFHQWPGGWLENYALYSMLRGQRIWVLVAGKEGGSSREDGFFRKEQREMSLKNT